MADYKQILERAARLCSTSEKASFEVRQKLLSWGLEEDDADKAIRYLQDQNFLDDSRYAGYYVRDKLKINKWGRIKILHMLRQKKIAENIIEKSIEKIDEALYEEILDNLIKTKMKSVGDPLIHSEKARIFRFAAQRGFTTDEIYQSLDRVLKSG